ncbi:hypothetical protein [Nostoc linckia]|nr:hypothetical protein [Nostoc linckia]
MGEMWFDFPTRRYANAHQPGDVALASLWETLARTRRMGDEGDEEDKGDKGDKQNNS